VADVADSSQPIQQPSIQFNQAVSEASITAIAALTNYLRHIVLPLGSIVHSMLDETTFNTQCLNPGTNSHANTWVIADGRNVAGSGYATLTGSSTIPDLRGIFLRSKNGARSTGTGNPDGDLAVGTYTADRFLSHTHTITDPGHTHTVTDPSHNHGITDPTHVHAVNNNPHSHTFSPIGHQHGIQTIYIDPYSTGPDSGYLTGGDGYNIPGGVTEYATGPGNVNSTATTISMNPTNTAITINTGLTGITIVSQITGITNDTTGSSETAPRNVTVNIFIRIN
jgi:hypothetical protein